MNILVTGGAGFLGLHLCERLLADGHIVYCVDNLYTGSLDNIRHLMNNKDFHFDQTDVSTEKFGNSYHDHNLNLIFNLASPASPIQYQLNPTYTFLTNILGAKNVLHIASINKCRVVQASTSEVYGDPLVHPQTEEYFGNVNPIGPRACYDEGKRGAETLFSDYRNWRGLNTGIFRIFNTYGPRMDQDDGRVVSNFIVAALKGNPLTIYGDGTQTRSFCYVDDLIEGIVKFGLSDQAGPMNIGNTNEFTIFELADIIVTEMNSGVIEFRDAMVDDPKQRKPNIDKAKSVLGWEPKVQLVEGIQKTIEYFRGKI